MGVRKYCLSCGKVRDGDSPLWCIVCEKKRIEKISGQFSEIKKSFGVVEEGSLVKFDDE
jgi:hypothetical protein